MEYIDGIDLGMIIEEVKGSIKLSVVMGWFLKLASALSCMHAQRVIHRDLKPDNIMITSDADLKVVDLGLARQLSDNTRFARTQCGTILFMAPEQIATDDSSSVSYDGRCDVWAAGCILLEVILGHKLGENVGTPYWSLATQKPATLEALITVVESKWSRSVAILLRSMLKVNPTDRPRFDTILKNSMIQGWKVVCFGEELTPGNASATEKFDFLAAIFESIGEYAKSHLCLNLTEKIFASHQNSESSVRRLLASTFTKYGLTHLFELLGIDQFASERVRILKLINLTMIDQEARGQISYHVDLLWGAIMKTGNGITSYLPIINSLCQSKATCKYLLSIGLEREVSKLFARENQVSSRVLLELKRPVVQLASDGRCQYLNICIRHTKNSSQVCTWVHNLPQEIVIHSDVLSALAYEFGSQQFLQKATSPEGLEGLEKILSFVRMVGQGTLPLNVCAAYRLCSAVYTSTLKTIQNLIQCKQCNTVICSTCAQACHQGHNMEGLRQVHQFCHCAVQGTCNSEPAFYDPSETTFPHLDFSPLSGVQPKVPSLLVRGETSKHLIASRQSNGPAGSSFSLEGEVSESGSVILDFGFPNYRQPRQGAGGRKENTIAYFEVNIKNLVSSSIVCVGICTGRYNDSALPGCIRNCANGVRAIGYHSDDGKIYADGKPLSGYPCFITSDIIGCGVTSRGKVYFVLNGEYLGVVNHGTPFPVGQKIYPVVGLGVSSKKVSLSINYEKGFCYDPQSIAQARSLLPKLVHTIIHPSMLPNLRQLYRSGVMQALTKALLHPESQWPSSAIHKISSTILSLIPDGQSKAQLQPLFESFQMREPYTKSSIFQVLHSSICTTGSSAAPTTPPPNRATPSPNCATPSPNRATPSPSPATPPPFTHITQSPSTPTTPPPFTHPTPSPSPTRTPPPYLPLMTSLVLKFPTLTDDQILFLVSKLMKNSIDWSMIEEGLLKRNDFQEIGIPLGLVLKLERVSTQ